MRVLALLVLGLAACTTPQPPADPPKAPVAAPSSGGFSPLRAQAIPVPGGGAWICAPGAAERGPTACAPAEPGISARPGVLPVAAAIGGPPEPIEGVPFTIPRFDAAAEIEMRPPA